MAGTSITNYKTYIDLMKNGVYDKLFFVDKLFEKWDCILDYGCADGFLSGKIKEIFPDSNVVGLDVDGEMLEMARQKHPDIKFIEKLDGEYDVVYFSSLLHEIYSYSNHDQIEKFWADIFAIQPKYIIFRDMIFDESIERETPTNSIAKLLLFCKKNNLLGKLQQFEKIWGKITNYKNFIHFLLKYSYDDNWEREVRENYLPLSYQNFLINLPSNYRIEYIEHYTLPFFKHKWEQDIGMFIDEKIHLKIILKKL